MDYQPVMGSFALASSTAGLDATALVDEFLQLPRKRLVIIGNAGSGKSTLALLLMLGLLSRRAREAEVEVPVFFSLLEWNPEVTPRVQDYLVASLERDYQWLEKFGARTARSLVERGMVLPVLDGLDEVPSERRVQVLDALNRSLGIDLGLILTSRTDEFARIVQAGTRVTGATVVQPEPLSGDEIAHYLRRCLPGELSRSWSIVLASIVDGSARNLLELATAPLWLWLIRAVHVDGAIDPYCLVDGTIRGEAALREHLLGELIPAVVRSRQPSSAGEPFSPRRKYRPSEVELAGNNCP